MIELTPRFYFANLAADVARSVSASLNHDEARYRESLDRTSLTLEKLRATHNRGAYEEALLLTRGLALAHEAGTLATFKRNLDTLAASLSFL